MRIRKANSSDFRILWKILANAPELQSDAQGDTYDKQWLNAAIENKKENMTLIYEEDGNMRGFAIAHFLSSVKQTIINDIYVFPNFRRKGIAVNLVKECEKESRKRKFKYITGLIRTNNKNTMNFFNKIGYKKGNSFYFYEKRLK